jgi:hypothetical protein
MKEKIMKSNSYTKGLLLLIALFLGIIACKPSLQSDSAVAQSSAKLNLLVLCDDCVTQTSSTHGLIILDQNIGKVWAYPGTQRGGAYSKGVDGTPIYLGMMNTVGGTLQIQKQ